MSQCDDKLNEYITKRQAFDAIAWHNQIDKMTLACYDALLEEIWNIPQTDVEPVRHAWWIEEKNSLIYPHCSMCGKFSQDGSKTLFCPQCGAKMDGEESKQ